MTIASALRWITDEPIAGDQQIPQQAIGPFLPMSERDIEYFNDALSDEIDSSFASSCCCCDSCYDDFAAHWPAVAFREMEFQKQSMGVHWLVENCRLPGVYSPAEISSLRDLVVCTRCGSYISANIWIYEHRFSDAEEVEAEIDELLTIGNETPFLILEHQFARRVLNQIREQAKTMKKLPVGTSLFRARTAKDVISCNQLPSEIDTYGPPPARVVGEGRFNHAGTPMLYLATREEVAVAEIGQPNEDCYIGELEIVTPLSVLDLVEMEEDMPGFEIMKPLASSALLAAPNTGEGWLKRQYVFSRFVGDCARSAGFESIRYGSTKKSDGTNYVLLNPTSNMNELAVLKCHGTMKAASVPTHK